jgi:YfiH family protein
VSTAHHFVRADGSIVEVRTTDLDDGDFHIDSDPVGLRSRRASVMDGEWAVVRQVHSATVVDADPNSTPDADGLVTATPGQPIAVQGADCAPIAFITDGGPIAVAHAGWRGIAGGIVSTTVEELERAGAITTRAIVGPVIGPECYAFGEDDLDRVAAALGDDVRGSTSDGAPALDLRAAITSAFAAVDVYDVQFVAGCTACGTAGFSHRARSDTGRHALAARILVEGGVHGR